MTETQFEDLPEGKWGSVPTWVTSHIYRGILSQVVEEKGRPVFEPRNQTVNLIAGPSSKFVFSLRSSEEPWPNELLAN